MDGVTAGPTHLEATYLSSINDAEYRAEAFLFRQKGLYKSLYGSKSDDELERSSESALQLSYNVSGGNHVSIERTFAKTLDIRFYKTLNLWYNCRSFGSGDALRLRIGSSEDDYSEYTFVLSHVGLWQQAKLVLRSGSSGDIEASSVSGNPDFKRISYIRLYIDAPENSGKIWINDIYVSDPMSLESSAHGYETEIKSTQPLFRMKDGTPGLSDFNIKYVHKGHGAQFSSVGQTVNDISERYQQVFTSVNIIPNLSAILDYTGEESETDSLNENITEDLRGRTSRNVVNLSLSYRSTRSGVPSISLSDRSQFYKNWLDEEVSGETIQREKDSFSHAPVMVITEKMDGFIYGTLSTRLMVDLLFNKEDISRSSATLDQSSLESLVSTSESEKRQRNRAELEMTYNNRYFYIRPSADFQRRSFPVRRKERIGGFQRADGFKGRLPHALHLQRQHEVRAEEH
jgi:hypothetical protein